MQRLTKVQLKALSEFLNTIAAAWFTAGVISPFFIKIEDVVKVSALGVIALLNSGLFLWTSIKLLKGVKS